MTLKKSPTVLLTYSPNVETSILPMQGTSICPNLISTLLVKAFTIDVSGHSQEVKLA
ncbi:MAG: hypothetical protein H0U57_03495 [Tatlockia sp.]|nr:hypothetical protein [Tatlockia sp.]